MERAVDHIDKNKGIDEVAFVVNDQKKVSEDEYREHKRKQKAMRGDDYARVFDKSKKK